MEDDYYMDLVNTLEREKGFGAILETRIKRGWLPWYSLLFIYIPQLVDSHTYTIVISRYRTS